MRDLLKKIKKANFYDLKDRGEFEDKGLLILEDSKNYNYKDSKLYKELIKLNGGRPKYVQNRPLNFESIDITSLHDFFIFGF